VRTVRDADQVRPRSTNDPLPRTSSGLRGYENGLDGGADVARWQAVRQAAAVGLGVALALAVGAPAAGAAPDRGLRAGRPGVATAGPPCPTPFTAAFEQELQLRWPDNRFTAAVVDLRTGCEHRFRPDLRITTASVFKIEVLAGVLLRAQEEGRAISAAERAQVVPMITESANAPTSELYRSLGGTAGFARLNEIFGLGETSPAPTTWGLTSTSAADQVHLVRQVLVDGGPLTPASRAEAWALMGAVVPEQRWAVGAALDPGWQIGLKNGFAGSRCCGWRINSAGAVLDPRGGGWVVAVLTDGWPRRRARGSGCSAPTAACSRSDRPASTDRPVRWC
jgi:beta-lactamase class A